MPCSWQNKRGRRAQEAAPGNDTSANPPTTTTTTPSSWTHLLDRRRRRHAHCPRPPARVVGQRPGRRRLGQHEGARQLHSRGRGQQQRGGGRRRGCWPPAAAAAAISPLPRRHLSSCGVWGRRVVAGLLLRWMGINDDDVRGGSRDRGGLGRSTDRPIPLSRTVDRPKAGRTSESIQPIEDALRPSAPPSHPTRSLDRSRCVGW